MALRITSNLRVIKQQVIDDSRESLKILESNMMTSIINTRLACTCVQNLEEVPPPPIVLAYVYSLPMLQQVMHYIA